MPRGNCPQGKLLARLQVRMQVNFQELRLFYQMIRKKLKNLHLLKLGVDQLKIRLKNLKSGSKITRKSSQRGRLKLLISMSITTM